jgi:hypothetical protein
LSIDLKSTFGHIEFDTVPTGAAVEVVDSGERVVDRGTTPFRSTSLVAGSHTLRIVKDMHLPVELPVAVPNGLETAKLETVTMDLAVKGAATIESLSSLRRKLQERFPADLQLTLSAGMKVSEAVSVIAGACRAEIVIIDRKRLANEGISPDVALPSDVVLADRTLDEVFDETLRPLGLTYQPRLSEGTGHCSGPPTFPDRQVVRNTRRKRWLCWIPSSPESACQYPP